MSGGIQVRLSIEAGNKYRHGTVSLFRIWLAGEMRRGILSREGAAPEAWLRMVSHSTMLGPIEAARLPFHL